MGYDGGGGGGVADGSDSSFYLFLSGDQQWKETALVLRVTPYESCGIFIYAHLVSLGVKENWVKSKKTMCRTLISSANRLNSRTDSFLSNFAQPGDHFVYKT